MALECFTWVTQLLFGRHRDDESNLFTRLPDCLLIDILSRLPADCLFRCQRDCRVWKKLISSRNFSTLQLKRARPVVIIQCQRCFTSHKQNLFVFDESLNNKEIMFTKLLLDSELTISKVGKHNPYLRHSCEGVLLLSGIYLPTTYFIFNPITQEEVIVQHKFDPGYLCALYYCSLTREFKLLYARKEESSRSYQYSIYTIRTQMWKKIHCPTPNLMPYISPAIVNGAVHLLVGKDLEKPDTTPCAKGQGIMVLNTDKEELSTKPHPGSVPCSSWREHKTMSLLAMNDESLSFCQLLIFENAMDIWILEDYETWLWTKKCKINLVVNIEVNIRSSMPHLTHWQVVSHVSLQIKPLHFLDGELVLYWYNIGLFMYNLDHNTMRIIQGPQGSSSYTCQPYKKSLLTIA